MRTVQAAVRESVIERSIKNNPLHLCCVYTKILVLRAVAELLVIAKVLFIVSLQHRLAFLTAMEDTYIP